LAIAHVLCASYSQILAHGALNVNNTIVQLQVYDL